MLSFGQANAGQVFTLKLMKMWTEIGIQLVVVRNDGIGNELQFELACKHSRNVHGRRSSNPD